PTGDYRVRFLLLRAGKVVSTFDRTLVVEKGGVSAEVFHFAHNNAVLYGLLAILAAVFAGWGASQLFRRR
ncbi:MAG: TIGR02186 family protein, partial [Bauldia litoralis]